MSSRRTVSFNKLIIGCCLLLLPCVVFCQANPDEKPIGSFTWVHYDTIWDGRKNFSGIFDEDSLMGRDKKYLLSMCGKPDSERLDSVTMGYWYNYILEVTITGQQQKPPANLPKAILDRSFIGAKLIVKIDRNGIVYDTMKVAICN